MGTKLPATFELNIEKLTPSGEGLGHFEGRPVYVFGVVPGDSVLVKPLKVSRRETKAAVVDVLKASVFRRLPKEEHFLSCAPYQILAEEKQLEYKKELVKEIFRKKAEEAPAPEVEIAVSSRFWNYRNKMEFSFSADENGALTLAFFQRFRHNRQYCVKNCAIAHERINQCAEEILIILREKEITREQLKNIVFRYSYAQDQCLAALFVVDEQFPIFDVSAEGLTGWMIIYSDPLSPAAKTTRILHAQGDDCLVEEIGGLSLKYFYDSFFQINPPTFEKIVTFLRKNIQPGHTLVDFYSGVGTIGFALAKHFQTVYSLESVEASLTAARENVERNALNNVAVIAGEAEKPELRQMVGLANTLICDPPRSGLHPKILKAILEYVPAQFAYVSCNPITQAADYAALKEKYNVSAWHLFDLYPQTPHVESVLILERKS